MMARRDVLLWVAQFVAKIGSLHLAPSVSVYLNADSTPFFDLKKNISIIKIYPSDTCIIT